MTSRRAWVQSALGAAVFPALRPNLESGLARQVAAPEGIVASAMAGDDEAYWAQIRAAFEHTPGQVNLVTVVRGVTTRATRDAIAAETERLNAFRPRPASASDPQWKDRVRGKVAAFLNAPKSQVALVRNTTEGVTTVLLNWPLQRGDEILCTATEHGAFYGTLAYRAARDGITVRPVRVAMPAASPQEIVDAFARAMTARTRLVLLPQVVLYGQIMPVRAITDLAHARGARVLVDGVLSVGHIPVDVAAMDCDFFAAGFHKWGCGPRGTAAFIVKAELVEELAPLFGQGIPSLDLPMTDYDGTPLKVPRWRSPAMAKFESTGGHPDAHYYTLKAQSTSSSRSAGSASNDGSLH